MAKFAVISADQQFVDELAEALNKRGHDTVHSLDTREALAFVQAQEPDVVTLEGALEDPLERIGLVGFAGANSVLGKQPIMVFTAVDLEVFGHELRDLQEMDVHFLRKPLVEDELSETLQQVVSSRQ